MSLIVVKPAIYRNDSDGTMIMYAGMSGFGDHQRTEMKLAEMWEAVDALQPTIVLVNMGTHWLHFYNYGEDGTE